MLNKLAASELVLNPDGSVYHLIFNQKILQRKFIRAIQTECQSFQYFDTIEIQKNKREFYTHTGTF